MTKLVNVIHEIEPNRVMHRGKNSLSKMYIPTPLRVIDGETYVVGMLHGETQWWVMPTNNGKLDEIEDIGPFEEFDDALIHLKLMSDAGPKDIFST